MIASTPLDVSTSGSMSPLERAKAFVVAARAAAADGLTWREFGELMVAMLRMLIQAYDAAPMLSGAEKKQMVLDAVVSLFDSVADKAVPRAAYPLWVIAKPAVRSLVVAIASGAVESLLPLVRAST